ncbi:phosphatase PAP2 family protein [Aeromicrobium fastidiosum]|uniref:phosphatase PAP2 family protein n=1 Tax=Aeromicrobium fastidiosum TaxID=52699 RepID=UPI00202339A6|nr:phosphatase PAP2 family protein [Aeromicrobium fastidiosum]MCL8251729.1 phosphatase PAP2 family protein [Aeromicrobium fastidiosum]
MALTPTHLPAVILPATIVASAATAFWALADSVSEHDGPARLDPTMTADVVAHRTSAVTAAARALTFFGSEAVVGVAALGLVVMLLERCGPRLALIVAGAMATSAGLTVGVKMAMGRARPGGADRLGAFDSTYSFPSGHTLNSAVFLGLVCLFLVPLLRHRAIRTASYALATAAAVGIGASRIYLGYHWTTDVLASWTIAAVVLAVAYTVALVLVPGGRQSGSSQVQQATVES